MNKKISESILIKSFFISMIMCITLPLTGYAQSRERTIEEMETIAKSFLMENKTAKSSSHVNGALYQGHKLRMIKASSLLDTTVNRQKTEPFYIFTPDSMSRGFVIVSGVDSMPAVLGYSLCENFDSLNIPCGMYFLLTEYAKNISNGNNYKELSLSTINQQEVYPLLGDIQYNQYAPFNDKCPMYNGEHTVTGCTATAMSQVMAYWKYPAQMQGEKISYTTKTLGLNLTWDCGSTKFDWDNMLGTYLPGQYTEVQGDAVATLHAACGASLNVDYNLKATGSYRHSAYGLYEYMGYDSDMTFAEASYFMNEDFCSFIMEEVSNGRPIQACGASDKGGAHAFVIDGYQIKEDVPYFHVNWGWSGHLDGYFLINKMIVGNNINYGDHDVILISGIKPEDGQDDGCAFGMTNVSLNKETVKGGEELRIETTQLANSSVSSFSGTLLAYAVDESQNEYLIGTYFEYPNEWVSRAGFSTLERRLNVPFTIPTGDYTVVLKSKRYNSSVEREMMCPSFPQLHIENISDGIVEVQRHDNKVQSCYSTDGRKICAPVKGINIVRYVDGTVRKIVNNDESTLRNIQ